MNTKRITIVLIAGFYIFSCSISASQEYSVVKVWPEVPQGWHFNHPRGVAVDKADNVYIGDGENYCVKKFDTEGRFITQWGSPGPGERQFQGIFNVKMGGSGIVYVLSGRIQKFTTSGEFIGIFERTAPDADTIKMTIDLTADDKGNILILAVDFRLPAYRTYGVRVEKYSQEGKFISQWGAEGGSGDGQLQLPAGIAVDAKGDIYITDGANHRVQKFDSSGKFLTKWGAWGRGDGLFNRPAGIAIDESGNVWVVDRDFVQKFTPEGKFLARWSTTKYWRSRIALDSHSNVYVTCEGANAVMKFDKAGNVLSEWNSAGRDGVRFKTPGSIVMDPSGNIVVADVGRGRIQKLTPEGPFVSVGGPAPWCGICDLSTDASGNLYIAWEGSDEIQKYDPNGKLICRWGSTGSDDGQFKNPQAVAVAYSANVYVADTGNNRVQKFTLDGTFLLKWGTEGTGDGQFCNMFFIAADDLGNVWVGDQLGKNGTHRMQKFDSSGRFQASWTRRIMTPPPTLNVYTAALAVDAFGNSYYAFETRIDKYDAEGT
jgi:tripartite motif-containing protein 71